MVSRPLATGTPTYMFFVWSVVGTSKIAAANPVQWFDFPNEFNVVAPFTLVPGDPATFWTQL